MTLYEQGIEAATRSYERWLGYLLGAGIIKITKPSEFHPLVVKEQVEAFLSVQPTVGVKTIEWRDEYGGFEHEVLDFEPQWGTQYTVVEQGRVST